MQEGPPPYQWLLPGVLAGGPHPERQGRLGQAALHSAFDAVLSVFEEPLGRATLEPWRPRYRWLKTLDGEVPQLAVACAFIDEAREHGVATLVHCWAGIGRTGTVLAAYLLHSGACEDPLAARDRVRQEYHPLAVESRAQLEGLLAFAQRR
jgi:atypical dual specificity phosphatase